MKNYLDGKMMGALKDNKTMQFPTKTSKILFPQTIVDVLNRHNMPNKYNKIYSSKKVMVHEEET